jgi:hypothetical protein
MHTKEGYIRNSIVALIIMLVMGTSLVITAWGKDALNEPVSRQIQLLTLDKDTNAYAQPSDTSEVLRVIKAGTAVAAVGEEGDYTVIVFQDHDEYIKTSDITQDAIASSESSAKESAAEVDEELNKFKKEDISYIESLERQRIKSRNALIWKTVIIVLVACIIAVSIIMGINKNKVTKEEK